MSEPISALLRPRYLVAHLLVIAIAVAFVSLGLWQLRRHAEVRASNEQLSQLVDRAAVPLASAAPRGGGEVEDLRMVVTEGEWRAGSDVALTPRSRGGLPGFDVLTVLETDDAGAVLVDRGWVALDAEIPEPPAGEVQVTGRLRAPQQAQQVLRDDTGDVTGIRTVTPALLVEQAPGLRTDLWVQQVDDELSAAGASPRPATSDVPLDGGSHLSYALQWFAFTLIGLVGYPLLLRRRLQGGADVDELGRQAHTDGDREALASPRP